MQKEESQGGREGGREAKKEASCEWGKESQAQGQGEEENGWKERKKKSSTVNTNHARPYESIPLLPPPLPPQPGQSIQAVCNMLGQRVPQRGLALDEEG